jgi:iron uptake system EfeUOB component EfeO/EfeM
MSTSIKIPLQITSMRIVTRAAGLCVALLAMACVALAGRALAADALAKGAADYKPFVVEQIGKAIAGARALQAAAKAGDAKAAQQAWINSRKGWEAMEPVTAEYFGDLDKVIDAWPDAKQGYHAIEAALFAGKLDGLGEPVNQLFANLGKVEKRVIAKNFKFSPQRLLSGTANLAYEVGEEKSKGGESPYAGTSIIDMQENVEGIEAAYKLVFAGPLKKADPELAKIIHERIEKLEKLVKVEDIKSLDQKAVHVAGEELAVLLQSAAPKLGLKKFKVGDEAK